MKDTVETAGAIPQSKEMLSQFARPVYMLMGLPIDAVTLEQALHVVRQAASSGEKCFLTTPNLNFAMMATKDSNFRDSVVDSDLVLADGMPLVWVARLLGIPVPERVAGSTLAESLQNIKPVKKAIRVYFFGGLPGVAERACEVLALRQGGLVGVGHHNPGFGTIEDMSSKKIISDINAAKPDLVLVSLGAKKGQAWIQANRSEIQAPVISHLGAVVNFFAGTVKRAPVGIQRAGLEWVWRIWEEHALFKRYWNDGWGFVRELLVYVLPLRRELMLWRNKLSDTLELQVEIDSTSPSRTVINVQGYACESNIAPVRRSFEKVALELAADIQLNLHGCLYVDAAFLGQLALLLKHQRSVGKQLNLTGVSPAVAKLIRLHGAAYLLD